jgi:hypothetical protein
MGSVLATSCSRMGEGEHTDGAFRQDQGYGGGGVVLQDHHGGFISVAYLQ